MKKRTNKPKKPKKPAADIDSDVMYMERMHFSIIANCSAGMRPVKTNGGGGEMCSKHSYNIGHK